MQRTDHLTPIPMSQVLEHQRLSREFDCLENALIAMRSDAEVGGMALALLRRALVDLARLLSREKFPRRFSRLPSAPRITRQAALDAIADARVALAAFTRAHAREDDATDMNYWLTDEEMARWRD